MYVSGGVVLIENLSECNCNDCRIGAWFAVQQFKSYVSKCNEHTNSPLRKSNIIRLSAGEKSTAQNVYFYHSIVVWIL